MDKKTKQETDSRESSIFTTPPIKYVTDGWKPEHHGQMLNEKVHDTKKGGNTNGKR